MKAIDFACRLLQNLEQDPMEPAYQRCLIALAAGLDCSQDVARHVVLSPQRAAGALNKLQRAGLVHRDESMTPHQYELSAAGREYIRCLLDFLPKG